MDRKRIDEIIDALKSLEDELIAAATTTTQQSQVDYFYTCANRAEEIVAELSAMCVREDADAEEEKN